MEKTKIQIPLLIFTTLCIIGLSACSQQTSSSVSEQSPTTESSQTGTSGPNKSSNQSAIYGKVTAIDGSKITLAFGTFDRNPQGRNKNESQGTTSGSNNQVTPPNGQNGGSGNQGPPPKGAKGGSSQNSMGTRPRMDAEIALSGETTTITISNTSIIKKMNRGERRSQQSSEGASSRVSSDSSASLSDIKVGTILSVEKNSDGTLTSVMIISGSGNTGVTSQK